MADNLTVKLGADTSEFRGQIASAAQSVGNTLGTGAGTTAGTKFVEAFKHRLFGAREISTALATALGLNFTTIAENVARFITGVSKQEEEAYKKLGDLSTQVADREIAASRSKLSAQTQYQLLLQDEQRLKTSIEENSGKSAQDQLRRLEDRNKLLDVQAKLEEAATKATEERSQRYVEMFHDLDVINEYKKRVAKEDEEANKKEGEISLEMYKKQYAQERELHELKLQALPPEERLIELQKERVVLEAKIAQEQRDGADTLASQIDLAKLDARIRADTLTIEKDITKEKKEQATEAMTASGDLGVARAIGGFATYNDPAQQKAYEQQLIESAKRDTEREIASLQAKIDAYTMSGSSLGKYELPALRDRVNALKGRENNLQDFVFNPRYRDAAGSGLFAQQVKTIGDPLKLLGDQVDAIHQVASGVNDLNTRLHNAGFGTGK